MPVLTPSQVARKKKRIKNRGGSVSTERTITIGVNGQFMNVPTIINGKQRSPEEAIQNALKNKQKFKKFKTRTEATTAAKRRSRRIGSEIKKLKRKKR
jgi:hypothetical protein